MILTYPCTTPFLSQKKHWSEDMCADARCAPVVLKGTGPEEGWISIALSGALEREYWCIYLRFHSLPHRSWCMQEKIWRCFSNPMSRCKNATQSHAARGNWPRRKLFATVHLLVGSTCLGWLKDAESPLPQIKTQHLLEWTEFNRPEYWGNPWSQIDIVLNLNF